MATPPAASKQRSRLQEAWAVAGFSSCRSTSRVFSICQIGIIREITMAALESNTVKQT